MSPRPFALAFLVSSATVFAADPPEPKFRAVTIDDKIQIGYGVAVADVDGDGKPDVLLADKKQFVWYRNPTWEKFILAENLTEKDNVCLAAQDLDGDGKCEIAVGAEWNPADTEKSGAVFYLIPPADRTQRWEPVKFPSVEPTTHRMKWVKLGVAEDRGSKVEGAPASQPSTLDPRPSTSNWGLVVVPLHGRGNKNGEGAPVKVLCYIKPDDVRAEWKVEVVDESMHMTHNFHVPLPNRSVVHLVGKEGLRIIMKLRPSEAWQWVDAAELNQIRIPSGGAGEITGGRLPHGGSLVATVEPMHGNALVAYTMAGLEDRNRSVLTDQLADGHALGCGDVLGAGSDQIIVGWRGNPAKPRPVGIKLFTPLDAKGEKWRESLIDDNGMACEDLVLADLNADGKLDIVASGRATKNVKLYFNETTR
jgi:FG-GAP-like repeat